MANRPPYQHLAAINDSNVYAAALLGSAAQHKTYNDIYTLLLDAAAHSDVKVFLQYLGIFHKGENQEFKQLLVKPTETDTAHAAITLRKGKQEVVLYIPYHQTIKSDGTITKYSSFEPLVLDNIPIQIPELDNLLKAPKQLAAKSSDQSYRAMLFPSATAGAVIGAAIGTVFVPGIGTIIGAIAGTAFGGYMGSNTLRGRQKGINADIQVTAAGIGLGASLGAAIGSVIPVVGTALGAVVGMAIGGYVANRLAVKTKNPLVKTVGINSAALGSSIGGAIGAAIGTLIFPGIGTGIGLAIGLGVGALAGGPLGAKLAAKKPQLYTQENKIALSSAATGTTVGVLIGAAVGTVIFPGIGTAIGMALGGLVGGLSGTALGYSIVKKQSKEGDLQYQSVGASSASTGGKLGALIGGAIGTLIGTAVFPGLGSAAGLAIGTSIGAAIGAIAAGITGAYTAYRNTRNEAPAAPTDQPAAISTTEDKQLDETINKNLRQIGVMFNETKKDLESNLVEDFDDTKEKTPLLASDSRETNSSPPILEPLPENPTPPSTDNPAPSTNDAKSSHLGSNR